MSREASLTLNVAGSSPLQKLSSVSATKGAVLAEWAMVHAATASDGSLASAVVFNTLTTPTSGYMGARAVTNSDLTRFKVWVGTVSAYGSTRTVVGYMDGNATSMAKVIKYPSSTVVSSATIPSRTMSTGYNLQLGDARYAGDVLEVLIWAGYVLKYVFDEPEGVYTRRTWPVP